VTSAFAFSVLARDEARFAVIWASRAWKSEGSSRAITCPFLTMELKSAGRLWSVPETWDPTWTVVTAWRVPVAPTTSTMSPRSTVAVV
jgi:hypothetical protein